MLWLWIFCFLVGVQQVKLKCCFCTPIISWCGAWLRGMKLFVSFPLTCYKNGRGSLSVEYQRNHCPVAIFFWHTYGKPNKLKHQEILLSMMYHGTEGWSCQLLRKTEQLSSKYLDVSIMLVLSILSNLASPFSMRVINNKFAQVSITEGFLYVDLPTVGLLRTRRFILLLLELQYPQTLAMLGKKLTGRICIDLKQFSKDSFTELPLKS